MGTFRVWRSKNPVHQRLLLVPLVRGLELQCRKAGRQINHLHPTRRPRIGKEMDPNPIYCPHLCLFLVRVAVKIGTGIGTIPAGCLTDSIAVGRWPVRGSAWQTGRTWSPGSDSEEEDEGTGKERAGMSLSREKRERSKRNGSKSIIRLANDLHACTGYKGNRMKRTKDRLANETTGVKKITAGRRIRTGEVVQGDFVRRY